MDAIIFTMGTRGDAALYFSGPGSQRARPPVTIGTHPCWKELVEESGRRSCRWGPGGHGVRGGARIRGQAKTPHSAC